MVRPVTRIALRELERTQSLVVFEAEIPSTPVPVVLTYRTRTGAVPAVDGITVGAFDREHTEVEIPACTRERRLELRVEREALPTSGLPSGKGFAWWLMLARSHPEPAASLGFAPAIGGVRSPRAVEQGVVLWGHSHLDVAWLWTYAQTRRKAIRTFANTLALFERDRAFSFVQSQPQLYEFVAQDDPELFARVRCAVRDGRLDPDVAAMWVEPDCNVPSGESLLRQMLYANRFCVEAFGVEPQIAWLPDSFGFARTLPTLLAHARIRYFATTKLQWNDTTRFPYAQFRWRGPDGSEITSALIDSYDGGPDPRRVAIARARAEPLVVGYGDGGGGPTLRHLELGERIGAWQRPREWFERLDAGRSDLPVHDDELYLEYHRGVYTTHHDMKSHNAALERALDAAEERVAWCIAVRAPSDVVARLREALERAWKIVLRNQFHDVLPGTSIHAVYDDARAEYGQAHELVAGVTAATRSILPRAPRLERVVERIEPAIEDDEFIFESALLRARVGSNGAITELSAAGGANACAQVNLLAAYRDRPRKWDAWNIDAGYKKKRISVTPKGAQCVDGGLEIRFLIGKSPATMRVTLATGEPFLRVDLAVDWRERHTLLRVENWLTTGAQTVLYGAPHGTVERSALRDTPAARARYEVPGARYAVARDERGGLALFALDTYGWSARALPKGGLQIGHSLLRSTAWPDPSADAGEMRLSYAYAPFVNATTGAIERAWEFYAKESRVRLFQSEDDAVLVVACKPAHDGRGVILRIRECDGKAGAIRLRCGARMREVHEVDGLERPLESDVEIVSEELHGTISGYGLRSYRVLF